MVTIGRQVLPGLGKSVKVFIVCGHDVYGHGVGYVYVLKNIVMLCPGRGEDVRLAAII